MNSDVERVEQVQTAMAENDVDGIVVRLAENILFLTGYWAQIPGLCLCVVPREGAASLLIPDYEEPEASTYWAGDVRTFSAIRIGDTPTGVEIENHLRVLAREHGLVGGAVGFEGSFELLGLPTFTGEANAVAGPTQELLRTAFETARLVDVTGLLERIRAVKTERELEQIRTVNAIAKFGLDAFKHHAQPGITEAALVAEVEAEVTRKGHGHRGARAVRVCATVCSGPDMGHAWQYFRSRARVIEPDDVVMLEMGTVADGYWSDHTRTVVAGKATSRQREAFDAAREAAAAGFAACIPGATGGAVDAAARASCSSAGFEQFPHHTGHGVGFRYHESLPQLVPGSDHVLEANMVVVTEPGIYEPGLGGFRWEDNAVVTASGAIPLVTTDYGLD